MPVRETSRAAYDALRDTPLLNQRQREVMQAVYRYFHGESFTRKQLAQRMGWEINRITGRVLELIAKGYLQELPERRDGGYLLRIKPAQQSLDLAA